MKKQLILLANVMVCSFAIANDLPQTTTNTQPPPMLKLGVYDTTNKVMREIEGLKYSVSQKGQRLCWTAFNMPFNPKNTVIEVFESPKKASFTDPNSATTRSKDGKKHTITSNIPSQNSAFLQRCWNFDNKDPKGQYRLTVQINQITFGTQIFHIIK